MQKFSDEIKQLIETINWTFAKTYAETWPHEYIVRKHIDDELFVKFVEHIRNYGYTGWFYQKQITYFDDNGFVYWTMGAPIEETIIINRTQKENSYEERLKNGTLPK
ncbi:MAG: hypothetical protein JXL97_08475 [Bacteroidales bacterium]|nr:hypothetical protein [Bacteroidales bacterium]